MSWFVAVIKNGAELAVLDAMEAIGLEVLKLRHLARISHARKVTMEPRPLFPGYGFIRAPEDRVHDILADHAVYRLLHGPEGPLECPESVIAEQRARIGADGYVTLSEPEIATRRTFPRGHVLEKFYRALQSEGGDVTRAWLANGIRLTA